VRHLGFRDGVGLALGLLFGLAPPAAWGAQRRDGVAIEPRPSWVDALATDGIKVPEPAGGVAVEAIDQQFRAVGKDSWSFVRSLLKVTTELGARTLGEQKIPFMPPYQRLLLHTVEVRRAGQSYPRLDLKNVRVLEREEKLDQNMYNGAKTAVVIIPDVRVGDEVLIEQSIVGANPVLAGHFGGQLQLGYPFGVGRLHQRVVALLGETLKATAALRLVPIFISAAWVAYLFESRRVRATFLPAPAGVEHVHAGEEDEGEDG
jgi:hypothetical protein